MLSSWTWGEASELTGRPPVPCSDDFYNSRCRHIHGDIIRRKDANRAAGRALKTEHHFVHVSNAVFGHLCFSCESIPEVTELYSAHADKVVWEAWPASVHPRGGDLPESRCGRKEEQVRAMLSAASFVVDAVRRARPLDPLRLVEFCGGSGYLALPLGCLFPELQVTLLDLKPQSVQRARRRLRLSGLRNVEVRQQDVHTFDEPFDVGVSLHACGALSDVVLRLCVERRAAFVICPCCIGKVLFARSAPLSQRFAALLTPRDFKHVLRAADSHHRDEDEDYKEGNKEEDKEEGETENEDQGRVTIAENRVRCKLLVEEDRRQFAREGGFRHTLLARMKAGASPKRDILVGWIDDPGQQDAAWNPGTLLCASGVPSVGGHV